MSPDIFARLMFSICRHIRSADIFGRGHFRSADISGSVFIRTAAGQHPSPILSVEKFENIETLRHISNSRVVNE